MDRICGVYALEHLATGRFYVGKSIDVEKRVLSHLTGSSGGGRTIIKSAIAKYGRHAFDAMLLERCRTDAEAKEREQFWIKMFDSRSPRGFNITRGGDGAAGYRHTDAHRAKMAEIMKGRVFSAETRAKMSKAKRGVPLPEEHRRKISAANTGKVRSEEAVERTASAHRGKIVSAETRARLAVAGTGKLRPEVSAANRARIVSDETRAKLSSAQRARWAKAKED